MSLSKWFTLFRKKDDAQANMDRVVPSQKATQKTPPAPEWEFADNDSHAGMPPLHDAESFRFARQIHQHYSSVDRAYRPVWWTIFYR